MHRISAFTPLCTPTGLFRYGSNAGGVPPTPVRAEWLNLLQEELCNLVTAFLPSLDAEDNTQLLKAVRALVKDFALKATTLGGYGILDAYTKTQTDYLLSRKADWAITLGGYGITDAYTKSEIDQSFALAKEQVDAALELKQDRNTCSLNTDGWHLDSATGRLEVWGQVFIDVANPLSSTTTVSVSFARAFPNRVLNVSYSRVADGGGDLTEALEDSVGFSAITLSGMNITARRLSGSNEGAERLLVQYRVLGF
ncbi:phage tail protein [Pseudomonas putida]|nr:phage tail protein [Pseudomonas putida]